MRSLAASVERMELQVEEEHPGPGVTRLSLRPGADRAWAELRDRISLAIAGGSSELVVDVSAAGSVDRMTASVLEGARARMSLRGGRLRVVGARRGSHEPRAASGGRSV